MHHYYAHMKHSIKLQVDKDTDNELEENSRKSSADGIKSSHTGNATDAASKMRQLIPAPTDTTDQSSCSDTDTREENTRNSLMENEMRAHKNRGFHQGFEEGKNSVIQKAFDSGYKKAFEHNFILSTLKGVASALKSSYNLNQKQQNAHKHSKHHQRPTSYTDSPSASFTTSTSSASSTSSKAGDRGSHDTASNSSSSSNVSSVSGFSGTSANINISSNHLSLLEAMRFDETSDIESIKTDLIKICRENRLEILAHYVSQIG